jgi:hypothetical protein
VVKSIAGCAVVKVGATRTTDVEEVLAAAYMYGEQGAPQCRRSDAAREEGQGIEENPVGQEGRRQGDSAATRRREWTTGRHLACSLDPQHSVRCVSKSQPSPSYELASVLFMHIVGYRLLFARRTGRTSPVYLQI